MTEVLVLGNGGSRLQYDGLIRSWQGEIWGCNRVYTDYGHQLARIATDSILMLQEIHRYRDETGADFETWAWGKVADAGSDRRFTSPGTLRANSGAMLAMQAIEEGHSVALCGFDMGGPDIYLGDLGSKPGWLQKWRAIVRHYGPDRFRFIGFDHMPGLMTEQEERMVKVRFKNGYETEMSENIARRMQGKGELTILEVEKAEKKKGPGRPSKKDPQPEPFGFDVPDSDDMQWSDDENKSGDKGGNG